MRAILIALIVSLSGCSTLNLFRGADCQAEQAGVLPWQKSEVESEARRESPNGYVTQPYSRENWDKYWNSVIYAIWQVDSTKCNGTYKGPFGREMVREIIQYRQQLGLPDINWEERNLDKGL